MSTDEQENAIASAELAVQNDPNNFELQIELGWAYFNAERLQKAMDSYQRAAVLNPNASAAFNGMGRVYERLGPPQAALDAYQRAIGLDPDAVPPYVGLGIIYFDYLVDYEAAVRAFQMALQRDPKEAFALALLAITYARMGRLEEASAPLQEAIRL
jgi:tetratricopeptide (TPR) repeat protein